MSPALWIALGIVLFVIIRIIGGVRWGRRERMRLEALFQRIMEQECPMCATQYGPSVRDAIVFSAADYDQLPTDLAKVKSLSTWEITCPHCRGISLLTENDDIFTLAKLRLPRAEEKRLSTAYLTVLVLLTLTVIGVSVYSTVRFFMR